MTNSNENSRLDRIEAILERIATRDELTARRDEITAIRIERLSLRSEENERNIQALNQATQTIIRQMDADRLKREEEKAEHEQRIALLEDTVNRLTRIEEAQNKMLASMDEDRPTVLKRLMSIENKVDTLIERDRGKHGTM